MDKKDLYTKKHWINVMIIFIIMVSIAFILGNHNVEKSEIDFNYTSDFSNN